MFESWTWYLGIFNNITNLLYVASILTMLSGAILTHIIQGIYWDNTVELRTKGKIGMNVIRILYMGCR